MKKIFVLLVILLTSCQSNEIEESENLTFDAQATEINLSDIDGDPIPLKAEDFVDIGMPEEHIKQFFNVEQELVIKRSELLKELEKGGQVKSFQAFAGHPISNLQNFSSPSGNFSSGVAEGWHQSDRVLNRVSFGGGKRIHANVLNFSGNPEDYRHDIYIYQVISGQWRLTQVYNDLEASNSNFPTNFTSAIWTSFGDNIPYFFISYSYHIQDGWKYNAIAFYY